MVNVEQTILNKYPALTNYPSIINRSFIFFLKRVFHEKEVNSFLLENSSLKGIDFIDAVIEYFNFKYIVSNSDKENIPTEGRVIIVANHPLGALDALALIKLVGEVRRDVKVVANDMLNSISNLESIILPIDNMKRRYTKDSIKNIYESLEKEEAVIIFPSGEVSRAKPTGIKDKNWQSGFLKFAGKSNSPILPVHIKARNSFLFYTLSSINQFASSFLLVNEMFKQRDKEIKFRIGELIPYQSIVSKGIDSNSTVKLLKKHLTKISKSKKGFFSTEKAIAHPENRQILKKELVNSCKLIGTTGDNKRIYLYGAINNATILNELGRLREYTFRKVGEGSGKRRDNDRYDFYYKHIILWDEENLEIVGSYRIGEVDSIIRNLGSKGLYTSTLVNYGESFKPYLENSIELGRSFVQPRYWGSRALDILWYGIGAYLKENPQIEYMFGTVSLSGMYPQFAQEMIVYFYKKFFGVSGVAKSVAPFNIRKSSIDKLEEMFSGETYQENMVILKKGLREFNLTIPTLFKQYTELCEEGGIKFLDFGVDDSFNGTVDGFIVVDISKIKESKRARYIGE